jgi:hypothetical protein
VQRRTIEWFLVVSLFLVGCASIPAAVPAKSALPAAEPTPIPVTIDRDNFSTVELPATQTAVPTPPAPATATPGSSPADSAATPAPTATFAAYGVPQTIGTSAGGRPIESYRFGFGSQTIVLVGGIHGGYEWNTIRLAYEMIDYFLENPDHVPDNVSLYIIPSANPDGQFAVTGVDGRFTPEDITRDIRFGRLNANQVDLNRNFACDWQPEGLWGDTLVSGGEVPFSEPETAALRTFILRQNPAVVVFWHSKADGIFIGGCEDVYQPAKEMAEVYGRASGYRVYEQFTAYEISGDASDWLATQNIPSFTVELETRSQTEYSENLAGVLALLDLYGR